MTITTLGAAAFQSPLATGEAAEILVPAEIQWLDGVPPDDLMLFEKSGPRAKLFFDPPVTRAAIVTCGGLCPGLNNVIRSVTRELRRSYGVKSVPGIRGGYKGLDPARGKPPIELTEELAEEIHQKGGTLLGTSRAPVDIAIAVAFLIAQKIDILFTVGGQDVNFCLVPERPFVLECLLAALERRLKMKEHAVIVVAEGAGQDLLGMSAETVASGNAKLENIGHFLRDTIGAHFKSRGVETATRYFDPSYQIRGRAANTEDSLLCDRLGRHAVHAAMSGKTGLVISYLHGQFVQVPINLIATGGKRLDLDGELWSAVLSSTGQPSSFC